MERPKARLPFVLYYDYIYIYIYIGCRPCRRPRKQVWWISYIWLLVEAGKFFVPTQETYARPANCMAFQRARWPTGGYRTNTVRTNARCLAAGAARRTSRRTPIRRQPCIPTRPTHKSPGKLVRTNATAYLWRKYMLSLVQERFHASSNSQIRMCRLPRRTRKQAFGCGGSRRSSVCRGFQLGPRYFPYERGEVPRKQTLRGTMGATAWAGHLLCSGYGQSLSTSVAREARHRPRQAHMAAAQRR